MSTRRVPQKPRLSVEEIVKATGLAADRVVAVLAHEDVPVREAVMVGGLLSFPGSIEVPRG